MNAAVQAEQRHAGALKAPADNHLLYDQDLCAWANHNAMLLREGHFDRLDIEHIIEELTDMSKSEKRALSSHLQNLLLHLLKWQFQPNKQSASWRASIRNARSDILETILESPSLAHYPEAHLSRIYAKARDDAADETGLAIETFPINCPYPVESFLQTGWLPD